MIFLSLLIILCSSIIQIEGCWNRSASKVHSTKVADKFEANESARSRTNTQGTPNIPTPELKKLSEELFRLATPSSQTGPSIDIQGKLASNTKNDLAPRPLFTSRSNNDAKGSTSALFKKLFNNYEANVKVREDNTASEKKETEEFLNAISNTPVMKKLEEFLTKKGLIKTPLKARLKQLWFTPYSRNKNVMGSSGFEHVFLGEIKDGKVSGFHNWIYFTNEEGERDLDYRGHHKVIDISPTVKLIKMNFNWLNKPKTFGSMFVGTPPELEMAFYTLCYYARKGKGCNLKMNGKNFRIKIHDYKGRELIGSAYPEVF